MACNECDGNTGLPLRIPNGQDGENGQDGQYGGWSQRTTFDTGLSPSPLASRMRLNNETPSSVTEIYINDLNAEGVDINEFLDGFDNNGNYGSLKLWKQFDSNTFWQGKITGVTDNGADHTLNVEYVLSNGLFASDDSIVMSFMANGANGTAFVEGTYSEITALIGTLTPGGTYILTDYETKHVVPWTFTLNVDTPGYTTKVERLKLTARDDSSFYHEVESENYPMDDILYDFTNNSVLTEDRPGLIYWRKDNEYSNEAWFDVRNQIVARYALDFTGYEWVAGQVDREQVVTNNGYVYQSVRDGASVDNFRLVDDISNLMGNIHTSSGINYFGNIIPADLSTISYHEAIGASITSNVKLGKDCIDILIDLVTDVTIGSASSRLTILGSSNVTIGGQAIQCVLQDSGRTSIGSGSNNIFLSTATHVTIGKSSQSMIFKDLSNVKAGDNVQKILLHSSDNTVIGDESISLMVIRASTNSSFGTNCSGISLGYSSHNSFEQYCSDIEIYSGGHNRFAQGCNVIGLIGELDNGHLEQVVWPGQAIDYYSPYSQMEHNTFGTGCSNINFYILGGRGNQFGDECKNLAFTKGDYTEPWRLVGTHWVRGIQNKTFQDVIHGASFLVPNQYSVTVTTADWYAQIFSFKVNNDSPSYLVELPDVEVASSAPYGIEIRETLGGSGNDSYLITSGGGATKASITAAMAASINAGTYATATVVGEKLFIRATSIVGLNNGAGTISVSNIAGNWVIIRNPEDTPGDHRLYQEEVQIAPTHSAVLVGHDATGASGTEGYGTVNGELTEYGNLPTGMRINGDTPSNKAFMWTSSGYPLHMSLQRHLSAGGEPTPSLDRPVPWPQP